MPPARDRVPTAEPRNDAYVGMLAISLVFLLAGCVFLFLDFSSYGKVKPEVPAPGALPRVDFSKPGVSGAGGAAGAVGAQGGAAGMQGAIGAQGAVGAMGAQGAMGAMGGMGGNP